MGAIFTEGEKVPSFQVANRLDCDEKTFAQVCSQSLEWNISNK